jgi:hypothetical protein
MDLGAEVRQLPMCHPAQIEAGEIERVAHRSGTERWLIVTGVRQEHGQGPSLGCSAPDHQDPDPGAGRLAQEGPGILGGKGALGHGVRPPRAGLFDEKPGIDQ